MDNLSAGDLQVLPTLPGQPEVELGILPLEKTFILPVTKPAFFPVQGVAVGNRVYYPGFCLDCCLPADSAAAHEGRFGAGHDSANKYRFFGDIGSSYTTDFWWLNVHTFQEFFQPVSAHDAVGVRESQVI